MAALIRHKETKTTGMQLSIRHKILLFVGILIYAVILGFASKQIHKNAEARAERQMTELAAHYASRFDAVLGQVAQIARG